MVTISINPVIFSIGHFHLRWYSLIVMTAIATGVWLAAREAERKGFGKEAIYDGALWVVLAGLIGARLFHVLDHWSHGFAAQPIRALYMWEGGLAIWGGVRLLDAIVPGLVLAQAIGRTACIITGDAAGKPTAGPFGLAYTHLGAAVPQLGVYYTPTQVYEIIMNLTIFAILWQLRRKKLPDGALFLIYLVLYSGLRFLVTFWSSYQIVAFGLNQAQWISLAALMIGLPWLVYLLRRYHAVRSLS
jgi:phosphatidylglycerol:prolipoprotein diacylglycerol transferase